MAASSTTRPAPLSELHLLMTYECNFECDHCFVWSGSSKGGTMTDETLKHILDQADKFGAIEWIYFEGGEPSLYYERLCSGIRMARERGFRTGIVSNASWATTDAEALEWLRPFAGVVEDLSVSDDPYHGSSEDPQNTLIARRAAEQLGIPVDFISVGESTVLYRGRAAEKLAPHVPQKPWDQFTECPWEDLRHPNRVHVDAYGNLHICQGISIGNLIERSLTDIMHDYDPDTHPVTGPLLDGGPVELVKRYGLQHDESYADACHLCYLSRCKLRDRFPEVLTPGQMYGID